MSWLVIGIISAIIGIGVGGFFYVVLHVREGISFGICLIVTFVLSAVLNNFF